MLEAKGEYLSCVVQEVDEKRESGLVLPKSNTVQVMLVKSMGKKALEALGDMVGKKAVVVGYKNHLDYNKEVIVNYSDVLAEVK